MVQVKNWIRAAVVAASLFIFGSTFGSAQTNVTYIEKQSGWESCSVCAGPGGKGASTPHSMTRNISSPTMGAKSAKYSIGGSSPYAAALWWKQLGGKPSAHNFVYDMYFYMKNPSVSQALEFDVNQSVNGKKYIFGTQCNIKGTHTWDVWSVKTRWVSTGIACSVPAAYKWHHVVFEFQRTSGNQVKFISITMNGVKKYINRTYAPKSSGVSELNVAFQMDGNKSMTDYDTFVEKVALKYW